MEAYLVSPLFRITLHYLLAAHGGASRQLHNLLTHRIRQIMSVQSSELATRGPTFSTSVIHGQYPLRYAYPFSAISYPKASIELILMSISLSTTTFLYLYRYIQVLRCHILERKVFQRQRVWRVIRTRFDENLSVFKCTIFLYENTFFFNFRDPF